MPLFGRERELEVLRSAVARRTGALIRLCGEPGIGKTSLASAIFEGARESGLRVGWARAWRGAPAFDAFRSALGVAPMAGPSREATFEAIRRELEARGHVLVVLDDIHEADSDSLDLLAWLAPQLRMMTALMIVTERSSSTGADAGTTSKLAKLARHATTIELGPLSPAAVGELIAQSSGIAADARLVEAVHRGTSGNALFVDGVVRAAVRDGTLTSGTIRFPRDVEQAIAERINDAGEGIADALRVCAILARPFTSSIVANVLSRAQLEVADLLRRACDENLIVEKDATFTFRHPLVAEAIAGSLEASTRTELHAAVARAIGDAASPSELAYHHAHAVPTVPVAVAIASCRRAAEAAAENTAHEEEVRFRTLVVSLLGNAREASAELELGRAIFRAGRNDDARATFARAASLARDTDPALYCEIALAFADTGEFGAIDAPKLALLRDAVGFAETQSPSVGIRIRSRLGAELWMGSATRAEADELTRNAIADARALGDDDVLFTALDCRFQALWGPGTLEERIALAGELGERARRLDDRLSASRRLLLVAAERGDVSSFERALTTFAELAGRLARPSLDETVLQRRLWLALVRGDLDLAERLTKEIYELDLRIQNPQLEMGRRFSLSAIALARGDLDALRALLPGFAEDGERLPHLPFIRARLAQIAARVGDRELAQRELPRAVHDLRTSPAGDLVTLAALSFAADAAAILTDRESARELHALLLPHRKLFATIGASISVIAVAHALGQLERTLGDANAMESFREALALHRQMKAPYLTSETEREMGAAPARPESARATFRLFESDVMLVWKGTEHRLKRSRGLELLATLLARPGRAVHVLTLSGAEELPRARSEHAIDARARAAYAERLAELREEEIVNPAVRAEREALEDEIARAARPRAASDGGEKARVAVAKALRRAIDAVATVEATAADHFERNVRMGYECTYDPPPDGRIEWDVTM